MRHGARRNRFATRTEFEREPDWTRERRLASPLTSVAAYPVERRACSEWQKYCDVSMWQP